MVALIVGLKLTLLRNNLKRSVWRTIGLIIGILYALWMVGAAVAGLVALRLAGTVELTADVTVLAFSVLTLGWLIMSLLIFGVDETVDPSKFALLPVRARQLLPGLFISGLIGSPGIATVLVSLGLLVSWSRGPGTVIAAIIAVPLGVATCFLLSRFATAAAAQFLASRRFRDLAAVLLVLVSLGFGVGANLFGAVASRSTGGLRTLLTDAAAVLGWTPFGWAWSIPAEVAGGQWAIAGLRLVLAVGLVVGLWFGWAYFLDKRLTAPTEATGGQQRVRSGSWIDRVYPASPAGAVAARTLRYWRRDPRYLAGIAGFMIAPIVLIVAQLGNGGQPVIIAFTPVLLGLLMGMTIAQDLSYDGTAVWLHALTGIRGADDRAGRVMSTLTVLGPVLLVLIIVTAFLSQQWQWTIPVVGLSIGLSLVGLGVGCWVGVLWQYPAPPPGSSPFQKGSSGGLPSLLSFSVSTGLTVILILPTVALVIAAIWTPWLAYLSAVVGLITGVIVLKVGISLGGRHLDNRWPEILAAVSEDR